MKWAVGLVVVIGCGGSNGTVPHEDAGPDAAPRPALVTVSPMSVDYGTVTIGYDSSPTTIVALNTGEATSAPLAVAIAPSDTFRVTHSTCDGAQLVAQASCSIDVVASPQTIGAKTAMLTVGGAQVTLQAVGVSEEGITVSPTSHAFATTVIDATSGAQRFLVTNIGGHPKGPLIVTRTGTNPRDFSLVADTCSGATLSGGQSCSFDVTFAPAALGMRSAVFVVSGGGTAGASVMGMAMQAIHITPVTLPFGSTLFGATTSVHTMTVTYDGSVPSGAITIAKTGDPSNEFVIGADTCTAAVLNDGDTCHVDLSFAPGRSSGPRNASITVSASPGGTETIQMTADVLSGGALMRVNPSALDFATVAVSSAATQSFTITNYSPVTSGMIFVTRTGDVTFAATSHCTAPLANGDSCTVDVTFAPTATGMQQATFTVNATPGGGAPIVATGTGD